MKKYNKVIWTIFVVQLVVPAIVLNTAKVDDMTLAKGEVQPFNTGWVLVREDGAETDLPELPYNTTSSPGENVILENTIPKEYWGADDDFSVCGQNTENHRGWTGNIHLWAGR